MLPDRRQNLDATSLALLHSHVARQHGADLVFELERRMSDSGAENAIGTEFNIELLL